MVRIRRVKTNTEIHSNGFETLLPIKQRERKHRAVTVEEINCHNGNWVRIYLLSQTFTILLNRD